MSTIKIDIMKDSIYKITELAEYTKVLSDDIDVSLDEAINEIINLGVQKAELLNATAPKSGLIDNSIIRSKVKKHEGSFSLVGENAIYDEFGTGEEGANNPHPMKTMFDLNPYNSGPFVSTHVDINGKHYWFYKPMGGQPFFYENGLTYGIPSGKQMYNTLQYVRDIKDSVVNKHIKEDALDNYISKVG